MNSRLALAEVDIWHATVMNARAIWCTLTIPGRMNLDLWWKNIENTYIVMRGQFCLPLWVAWAWTLTNKRCDLQQKHHCHSQQQWQLSATAPPTQVRPRGVCAKTRMARVAPLWAIAPSLRGIMATRLQPKRLRLGMGNPQFLGKDKNGDHREPQNVCVCVCGVLFWWCGDSDDFFLDNTRVSESFI